jgi:hypothetical protein
LEFRFYENGLGYKPHQPGGSWVMVYKDYLIFKRRNQHVEENVRYVERDPAPGGAWGLFAIDLVPVRGKAPLICGVELIETGP